MARQRRRSSRSTTYMGPHMVRARLGMRIGATVACMRRACLQAADGLSTPARFVAKRTVRPMLLELPPEPHQSYA